MGKCLSIYLTHDCPACGTARAIAAEVERIRPDVPVRLMYLDDGEAPPTTVFGVPTYLWQGRIVSLGNPYIEDLLTLLEESDRPGVTHDVAGG